jgi:GntR family transcriptional repressor for pyruvate dehydrogenase complex
VLINEVTSMVSRGRCKPGERLGSEQDLIQRYGVSRAVIREGLRVLERDGLVTVKPGPSGGIFFSLPDVEPLSRFIDLYGAVHDVTPDDLVEARMELEVVTTRLAAVRADEDDLADLERLNGEWMECLLGEGDTDAQARVNVQFHIALARAAHNPVFVAFIDALEGLLYETALAPESSDRRLDYVVYSHEYILRHVRGRDVDRAGMAMRQHLETFRPRRLLKTEALAPRTHWTA